MTLDEKYSEECKAVGFVYIGRGSRSGYSQVKCMVCGGVSEYSQSAIRAGQVRCKTCYEAKMKNECSAAGFTWIEKVDGNYSLCRCLTCGHEGTFAQSAMRDGLVNCSHCQITKYQRAVKDGFEFINHFREDRKTYVNLKHECCDDLVKVRVSSYLRGEYTCPHCQITKYQRAVKDGFEFINHFCDGGQTYVNLKHNCSEHLVKVQASNYLIGKYDCPHCMHSHFSDPSYFYVIKVGDMVKLGISNRPDQRYTQYGLPEDATIIEHLRIPLETKRDALVVESYAKQLVKDYKIPTDIAKQVFTKAGFNECYTLESLDLLLTI